LAEVFGMIGMIGAPSARRFGVQSLGANDKANHH